MYALMFFFLLMLSGLYAQPTNIMAVTPIGPDRVVGVADDSLVVIEEGRVVATHKATDFPGANFFMETLPSSPIKGFFVSPIAPFGDGFVVGGLGRPDGVVTTVTTIWFVSRGQSSRMYSLMYSLGDKVLTSTGYQELRGFGLPVMVGGKIFLPTSRGILEVGQAIWPVRHSAPLLGGVSTKLVAAADGWVYFSEYSYPEIGASNQTSTLMRMKVEAGSPEPVKGFPLLQGGVWDLAKDPTTGQVFAQSFWNFQRRYRGAQVYFLSGEPILLTEEAVSPIVANSGSKFHMVLNRVWDGRAVPEVWDRLIVYEGGSRWKMAASVGDSLKDGTPVRGFRLVAPFKGYALVLVEIDGGCRWVKYPSDFSLVTPLTPPPPPPDPVIEADGFMISNTEGTIKGQYFTGKKIEVFIGSTSVEVLSSANTEVRVRVPEGLDGTFDVVVVVDGRRSQPATFTITTVGASQPRVEDPVIDSVLDAAGNPELIFRDSWVVIRGSSLALSECEGDSLILCGVEVNINGVKVPVRRVSQEEVHVFVPAGFQREEEDVEARFYLVRGEVSSNLFTTRWAQ